MATMPGPAAAAEASASHSDGPVATISQAQELVRRLKLAEPNRKAPIVVAILGGYILPCRADAFHTGRFRQRRRPP